ncbi:MAG TPA: hypothetical protein PKJ26_02940 [Candidatus Woesebacteria bacterium]|nr:hypothetical protein [Candidatus Woesebacteria bacterium]HNS65426.1 hypothetical protein [Candidatus Woesebacteria bacterium]
MKLQTILDQLSLDIEQYIEEEVVRRTNTTNSQFGVSQQPVSKPVSVEEDNFQSALVVLKKLLDSKKSTRHSFSADQELSNLRDLTDLTANKRFDVVPTAAQTNQQMEDYLQILIELATKPNPSQNESVFLEELSSLIDKTAIQTGVQDQSVVTTKSSNAFDGLKMFLRTIGDRNSNTTT